MQTNIQSLFYPKSIAVIGASRDTEKVGGAILKNLLDGKMKGKVFAVNPKTKTVQGLKSFDKITEIPVSIDLAVIIIPAMFVADVLIECGEKGVKAAIVISSGFKETGGIGEELEKRISEIAKKYKIAMVGPNCLGLINTSAGINASFSSSTPKKGGVGLISQSGAIVSSLIDWGEEHNLGFSQIVSLGNKASLDETDILKFLEKDEATKVIALYSENISRPKEFITAVRRISAKKPVVVFKSGTSSAGQNASQSHTGALATEDRITDALLRKSGAIRVDVLEKFLETARILNYKTEIPENIFVISNAGGLVVSAADEISKSENLKLEKINPSLKKILKENIPNFISVNNPLDIAGDAQSGRYKSILNALSKNKDSSELSIILIITPQRMTDAEKIAGLIIDFSKKLFIIPVFVGGDKLEKAKEILEEEGIPTFEFLSDSIKTLDIASRGNVANLLRYSAGSKKVEEIARISKEKIDKIENILDEFSDEWISMDKGFEILNLFKVPVADFSVANDNLRLNSIADKLSFPLVLKTAVGEIVHKAKKKQVICGISNKRNLARYFMDIKKPAIIQKQEEANLELIIGLKREESTGHLLMFGMGGVLANEMDNVKFHLLPLLESEVEKIIETSSVGDLLSEKVRGKLVDIILSLQKIALNFEEISDIDLNPVMVDTFKSKVFCVDVKIKLSEPGFSGLKDSQDLGL